MVAEPARDQTPEWDGQANTLERFEEDVLIFTHAVPKERKVTIGPKLLQQFLKSSPQREIGLELLKSGVVQLEDGATQLLKLIRLTHPRPPTPPTTPTTPLHTHTPPPPPVPFLSNV